MSQSEKNRQCNGQIKRCKWTNDDLIMFFVTFSNYSFDIVTNCGRGGNISHDITNDVETTAWGYSSEILTWG